MPSVPKGQVSQPYKVDQTDALKKASGWFLDWSRSITKKCAKV